ncbi:MAG: nucleotidyl transferase AbiEii/AbiGii toxin family protein [candidate division Zixibacteria bacterium]|nr:nucleotidyl transferase AbiEii/AbiGii toxin family protein [candidate division Zixibacteria bacterium]
MLQLLKDVYSDSAIAPFLGFKGGTAAFMFYGLSRFSVDLDFDLLNDSKEDIVFERIEKVLKKYGVIKQATRKRFSIFFLLSYQEHAHNIKVEINRRSFGSKFELKTYLGVSMLVMIKEDMFAHKLMAMYERIGKTSRDIFDVWFFLHNNWPINKTIVEQRAKMPFKELLEKCVTALEKLSNKKILEGIGELLADDQKAWARANLKTDTVFLLKLKIENEGV